ncbi:hypothetical protein Fot_42087 [Forsythia ovata]|uniref:Uncharacterized protein n=1 Tax=Forsythia ovata TaxID=205694 RepID=A0ABD1RK65_9LAMI
MAGFYISKILVFKIRGTGVVDGQETLLPQILVTRTMHVPVATVPLVLKVAVDISSTLSFEESLFLSKNVRRLDKENKVASNEGGKAVPKRSRKMKTTRMILGRPSEVG